MSYDRRSLKNEYENEILLEENFDQNIYNFQRLRLNKKVSNGLNELIDINRNESINNFEFNRKNNNNSNINNYNLNYKNVNNYINKITNDENPNICLKTDFF